jgi:predicted esterase
MENWRRRPPRRAKLTRLAHSPDKYVTLDPARDKPLKGPFFSGLDLAYRDGLNKESNMTGWKTKTLVATIGLLLFATNLLAENKVDKDVAYGTHERNVLDVYWNTDFKDAPIVFTIHGGGFKNGSKSYCNKDMQKLYMAKGCIVVSPNYRLKKEGTPITVEDCTIDCAMAVAYIQANAKKYGGDPEKIVSTGSSAGGYLSAQMAYKKNWKWPANAKYKPKKLNVIGWFGDSPYLPLHVIKQVTVKDVPGFIMYGGKREHPATPAKQGHDMQAMLKSKKIWSKMVYIDAMGHVPARKVLYSPRSRDKATHEAFLQFLDMVCYGKGEPKGGDVIEVGKKKS